MYGVLNIDKNKNELYNLPVIYDTNLLSLVTLWLDNNCQIQMKSATLVKAKKFREVNKALVLEG